MTKIYWGESNRTLRAAAAARARGDVFPLLLASFGCGPASFVEQVFQELLHGYPHAVLENDGHGGAAGFVTRIQAFLTSVRQHGDEGAVPSPADEQALALVEPTPRRGPYLDRAVRYVFMSGTDYLGDVFAAVYRAHGYDAVTAPPLSEETAACGRRDCSGKECLSYQLLWGAFRRWLEANPTDREVRLVQISGRMCRAGAFPLKDRISLSRLGLDDHVGVTALRTAGGPAMTARVWLGLVAVDLLRQLYLYHLAVEREAGEAERLYRGHAGAVLALLAAPAGRGPVGPALLARVWRRLVARVDRAAADFAALEARRDAATPLPTVFLSGDILTKGNDFAGGGLCQELSRRGVRVIFEPTCDFLEHLAEVHPVLLFGQGVTARSHLPYRLSMVAIRDALYARVKARHPFLPLPELARVLARTDELMARRTIGGSALTVGSALHHYESGAADGVVLAACWGCDNGVIAENLLRQRRELPALFYYDDGAPLDERRLDRFVFQLRRRMAQGAARTAAAARPGIERRALRRLGRLAHVLGASAAPP
jgi:predicted nucleotide-binding protein (sugar kinase/HSP70/actin superfamily)